MNTLEIIDSAVKIGLGAAITAIATVIVTLLHARHERRSEVRRRRLDLIERLTGEFEQVHSVAVELSSAYGACLECPNPLAAQMSWTDASRCLIDRIGPAMTTLHGLEGRLMLIGAITSEKALSEYRHALANLQNAIRTPGGSEGPLPTREDWQSLKHLVNTRRVEFFAKLRTDYERA